MWCVRGNISHLIALNLVPLAIQIYRLYVVWNRMNSVLIIPAILFVGSASKPHRSIPCAPIIHHVVLIVTGYGICYELAQVKGTDAIFASSLKPWITSFFSLSLTTNVLATSKCPVVLDHKSPTLSPAQS